MWVSTMLAAATFVAAHQSSAVRTPARAATIDARIDRSEWDPPIYLKLDVRSGSYTVTSAPGMKRRPRAAVVQGKLSATERQAVERAFDVAWSAGLTNTRCDGAIVISNAGPTALMLTDRRRRVGSPSQLGCWTPEARALQDLLSDRFW